MHLGNILVSKPVIVTPSAIYYATMPSPDAGGSRLGRAALGVSIGELWAGAGEIGGNNCRPWVRKYLAPTGLGEGESRCASFVSWTYLQACGGEERNMPFPYSPGARDLMSKLRKRGWTHEPQGGYEPRPGDLVFWWREKLSGWLGQVGLVHQLMDGMLYTIKGTGAPGFRDSHIYSAVWKNCRATDICRTSEHIAFFFL